jgi:hypothetical protein
MTLPNKKFINMDVQEDGKWWVEYVDSSSETPNDVKEVFNTQADALQFYESLINRAI